MSARLVVYKRRLAPRNQRWRWRLVAGNGRNIANGGEGYANRGECVSAAIAILSGAYNEAGMRVTVSD